uniref:Capsid protein n=1 Tax=Fusarium oxysporum alternavirus 1-FOM TaxID=3137743 RepID=A0AAU6QEH7_9VIRU
MSETKEEFRAYMDNRLANVLARLSASAASYQPTVPAVGTRPAPDPKPSAADYPEVESDQINDPSGHTSDSKRVSIAPAPAALPDNGLFEAVPAVISDVPLVRARPAEGIEHTTPVQSTLAGIDGAKVHFSNVVKQANSNLRSEGDLAANIAITLGQDATESTEATVTAVSGRVAAARIAIKKGARASRIPVQGMDVRLSTLRTAASDQRAYPDHSTVYIPSGLSDFGAAALVSLLPVGGPGAYVWRYAPGHADPGLEPAVVRWKWPGGSDKLLVVTEDDREWNVPFGGAALTEPALVEVENFYRRAWGDGIFDEGWKTAFTLAAVYRKPVELPNRELGRDFRAYQVSNIYSIDGQNVNGDPDWRGPADPDIPPDDATLGVFTSVPPSSSSYLGQPTFRAWALAFGRDFPDDNRPDPSQYASHTVDRRGIVYTTADGHVWIALWAQLTSDELNDDVLLPILRRVRRAVLHVSFAEGIRVDDDAPAFEPHTTVVRNVFGQNDRAVLLLPRLRLVSVLALLADISVTVPAAPVERWLSSDNMEDVFNQFGGHLHFMFIMSLSRQHLDPAVLRAVPLPGAVGMLGVPKSLRSVCVPRMMSEYEYDTGGLECLENGNIFRTFRNTPYAGFAVDGVWRSEMGIVHVNDAGNSYAGIDAAARATWLSGGNINVHTRLAARTHIGIIFTLDNLPNPFGIPRFVRGDRGVEGLAIQAGAGLNALLAGRSIDAFLWSSY